MKRLAAAVAVIALLVPLQGAIAGPGSTSGTEIAFYSPAGSTWHVPGKADFFYGAPGDTPLMCDWDGDGIATVGVYRESTGYLLLSDGNRTGAASYEFFYGIPGDRPLCGDWDGDGRDTIGIYRPSDRRFFLRNTNSQGFGDKDFQFGFAEGHPFAGDFNGDGIDTVGVRDPKSGWVEIARGNYSDTPVLEAYFGSTKDTLVVGDWDGDGTDRLGVFQPATKTLAVTNLFGDTRVAKIYDLGMAPGIPLAAEFNGTSGAATAYPEWSGPSITNVVTFQAPAAPEPAAPAPAPVEEPPAEDFVAPVPATAPASPIVTPAVSVPANAIRISPGTNIQSIVDANGGGATFLLEAGVHRMQEVHPKSGQTFIGAPGAVMSGARLLTSWQQDGSRWYFTGQTQAGRQHGSCESDAPRCAYPEELFINDVRQFHVSSLGQVGPGKWFFDYGADRIYIGENPAGKRIETSVTEKAFSGQVSNVTITGLVIEKYASPAQVGAIDTRANPSGHTNGSNWFIANNEVRLNHGVGIKSTDGSRVVGNYVHHNGQLGLGGDGPNMLIEDNEISYNNVSGYAYGWEGGGTKWSKTSDLVVRNNYAHHNVGPGLWTDIDNIRTLYEGNRVTDNDHIGIFHEISYAATIRNNYIANNGYGHSAWLWGAGIVVAASPDVEIYGNDIVNNADGIAGIQQNRSDAPASHGPMIVKNMYVHDNRITMSGGQTGLVQDVGDNSIFTSRNNRFVNNTYTVPAGARFFEWNNGSRTLAEWNGFGQS
ncbi:MAG: right-handed parallel beta-helix repeat-containing protein [Acidimicrobiia bacterium]|nr:right-handed parallel beta-helix repeat-containing protein [Acidimicrobiia bacterium]